MISDSFIEQLKNNSDIEQIISSYVNLRRRGSSYNGLCPFHSEKTPSFTVYPDTQSYYCFGCSAGGDVITFVRNIENLEYLEAVELLAQKAGMPMPQNDIDDSTVRVKAKILEINRACAKFFHQYLLSDEGKNAQEYILKRGLTTKTVRRFGIGFAPPDWDKLASFLKSSGFSFDEMKSAAMVSQSKKGSYYDVFRDRIIFPIIDLRGNVVGFGGRALGENGPKYLNSSDTLVFKKSKGLYSLNFAKEAKSDKLLLCEGYVDVIALHQAGFTNAVATLGTALTAEQAALVSRYAKEAVIVYDSDGAGQKATKRAIEIFSKTDVAVSVLELEGAKDPDEYIKKFGATRFQNLLNKGKSAVNYEIEKIKSAHDINDSAGKIAFLQDFCKLMADNPNQLQRDVYTSEIAQQLDIPKEGIKSAIEGIRKQKYLAAKRKESHNLRTYAQDNVGKQIRSAGNLNLSSMVAEEKLIALIWQNPDYYDIIRSRMLVEDFVDTTVRNIYNAIAQRLEHNQPFEMIYLSSVLGVDEIARLSRIIAQNSEIKFYKSSAEEFIKAIKEKKEEKTTKEVGQMSDEEYIRYTTSLASKKK